MSASHQPNPLTLSIFERLTDEQPEATKETIYQRWVGVAEFSDSVLTHLDALLNTRRSDDEAGPEYEDVSNSILTYGICDFTSMSCADPAEREKLRKSVERAIRLFEPRLARVDVQLGEWNNGNSAIHLRISGLLRIDPDPEPILIEATLAKDSRRFNLREGA